ncbi:hypothetical protein EDB92DRAFT_1952076 [Lactarius akahatsu]|uniref:DUF6534 domain-containing protein n=1 Tax=Lactarius akahatsu TaxID=416441 RepID=A0AAD4L751_9AGAM|nr:hypothetical protein EDB92DRAFT_1952076 [Lactarius akahatsu]
MPAVLDVKDTYGAVLLGCFVAVALSGVLALQTCIYYRLYPKDRGLNKIMVAVVWMLDATHTCLICSSAWKYLVANFGNVSYRGHVPITVAFSIGVTAFVTLITQLFYYGVVTTNTVSNNNWFIVGPLLFLVVGRVAAGLGMPPIYSLPLSGYLIALALIIVTTVELMDKVIGSIIVYTVNNGAITCVSTIVSMICWLTMPHNLIFMALHFAIGKMYANSLLATLNTRQALRGRAVQFKEAAGHPLPVLLPSSYSHTMRSPLPPTEGETKGMQITYPPQDVETSSKQGVQLHITVEKTVQYDTDDCASGPSPLPILEPKHGEV